MDKAQKLQLKIQDTMDNVNIASGSLFERVQEIKNLLHDLNINLGELGTTYSQLKEGTVGGFQTDGNIGTPAPIPSFSNNSVRV